MIVDTETISQAAPIDMPAHFGPVMIAVRDHGCTLLTVSHGWQKFGVEGLSRTIVLIDDNGRRSLGPKGFHRASLRRLARNAVAASIVSAAPHPVPYALAAFAASTLADLRDRKCAIIVETQPKFERAWLNHLQEACPDIVAAIHSANLPAGGLPLKSGLRPVYGLSWRELGQ